MKEFYININLKLYYSSILIIIILMSMGLFIGNPRMGELGVGYSWHIVLFVVLSACLVLYPRFETQIFRMIIILVASSYFYLIFFLYPETWSTFIFLCFIPAISIFFFDSKLFYFSLILNSLSITAAFSYIIFIDQGKIFPQIKIDLLGNIANFVGSQIILYLIFYLSSIRIQKLKTYYEQIQHQERLKTTGQLAAAVAHEIRNPLTVVQGFLQLYTEDVSFNPDVKRNFSLMMEELKTAEHVISHFLTFAKPDNEKKLNTIDVKDVLQNVTDILYSYGLLHDNKIEVNVLEDCYVVANIIEFKQLITNLVKNAVEASKIGETVFVQAEKIKDYVEIRIIDSGRGMSELEVKSLGTPFYTLKSKGTGLGLMICYQIVEKYHGTIHFQSILDEGTTVILRFPNP
ncbi:sensor histidine kinase [Neobacillus terrae]|uniref:sensor histidine kinase n=1 Tax=Neobacillus terrae TaxID=3034837 RepID=UPI00140E3603|nr:HAMP domain-containing sensor histidine kinase [Neobacillus terrae]NHM32044.1 HAMP domain-containing histidine kinase [Neobacillus terrae]